MKLYKQAHSVYRTQYHIVWPTRFRRKLINEGVKVYLKLKLLEVTKYYPDWQYVEIGVGQDHVHLHIIIPPKYAVAKVVETIKSNTSRQLNQKFSFLKEVYWDDKGIWSKGYFVSTVGINEEIIKKYVAMQEQEDAGRAQLELI
jgi:putative transposase